MNRFFLVLIIGFVASLTASAECPGTYFKETGRQMLSNPFIQAEYEDFDNDGLVDLLARPMFGSGELYFYKRLTASSFDTTSKNTSITNGTVGPYADVNNDGKKDIIVKHQTTPPIVTTYLNNGMGRFLTSTPAVNTEAGEIFWAAGDLNGDGRADVLSVIYTIGNNTSKLYYRLTQPDNSFGPAVPITTFTSSLPDTSEGVFADLNNDGLKDIAFTPVGTNLLKVLTNTGNSTFAETASVSFVYERYGIEGVHLKPVDLNNDGKSDFISNVFQDGAAFKVKVLANTGSNSFTLSEITVPSAFSLNNYYVNGYWTGDFDGDGDVDIILPGAKKYLLLKNQGSFAFTQQEFRGYLNIETASHNDGDARADAISVVRPFLDGYLEVTSQHSIYYPQNAISFRQNVCNPVGQTKTVDFDGDGFTDRSFWNPTTGIWRYYTENSQNNQITAQWGLGSLGDVPVPNDYDGDGITDRAVFRKPDGDWWVFRSSDQQPMAFHFGIAEDKPIPADYDGDGKADFAVFRPSDGNWHIWLSQTNQYQGVHFGITEDKPLPYDYDGDGKADVCVYRPSTGVWYRLNSSNGSFFAAQYGISTDTPIPADFDGDGKTNIAVYRDGNWFVLRNDFSTSIFNWGLPNDIPYISNDFAILASVYRKTSSSIYTNEFPRVFPAAYGIFATGNSFNEVFVSTILPSE